MGSDDILESNMIDIVEDMLSASKSEDTITINKVDWDLTNKSKINDLVSRIKNLTPSDKRKLEKLLSDAKS
jgi:hypothetical protein